MGIKNRGCLFRIDSSYLEVNSILIPCIHTISMWLGVLQICQQVHSEGHYTIGKLFVLRRNLLFRSTDSLPMVGDGKLELHTSANSVRIGTTSTNLRILSRSPRLQQGLKFNAYTDVTMFWSLHRLFKDRLTKSSERYFTELFNNVLIMRISLPPPIKVHKLVQIYLKFTVRTCRVGSCAELWARTSTRSFYVKDHERMTSRGVGTWSGRVSEKYGIWPSAIWSRSDQNHISSSVLIQIVTLLRQPDSRPPKTVTFFLP